MCPRRGSMLLNHFLNCLRFFLFFCYLKGVYCGPLRLLAWEVAKRLNKANVPCDLITGQEKELVEGANHKAVTVEMADVTSVYDCAIIDEIQASLVFYFGRRRNLTMTVLCCYSPPFLFLISDGGM